MKLFDDYSFDMTVALFTFRHAQNVHWSQSSCVGWFAYLFVEGKIEKVEAFTALS